MKLTIESEKHSKNKEIHMLRQITPEDITSYLDAEWNSQLQIVKGHPVTVPNGWHGEGKQGEVMVLFGDLLTRPMAGTELSSGAFTDWLEKNNFYFESGGKIIDSHRASVILSSDAYSLSEKPVFRAVRPGHGGKPPIQVEYYQGSMSPDMKGLSQIGNNQKRSEMDRTAYRGHVANLMRHFIAKGTTRAKEVLKIPNTMKKLRRVDDCLAGMTTIGADMVIEQNIHPGMPPMFEEIAVAVATTQAVTVAVWLADYRNTPLIIRAGGPSFGLAGPELGMNYMVNTQKDMIKLGIYTSGDFGDIMSTENTKGLKPGKDYLGNNTNLHETRFFLNGGGPIRDMMEQMYKDNEKPHHGIVSMRRASRIDNGPSTWGVIMSGINT